MTSLHALIIDDDAYSVHVMEMLLDQNDIAYTAVIDPTDLVDVLRDLKKVDIIFLDLEMPKLDGYEVLKILKERVGPEVPIVACTVHTAEIKTTRKLGFSSFIAKPLNTDYFSDQLHRILKGEPVWEIR